MKSEGEAAQGKSTMTMSIGKEQGEEFRETETSETRERERERASNGKLFAALKTNEIKRIHAARIRLTSTVWKTGVAAAESAS